MESITPTTPWPALPFADGGKRLSGRAASSFARPAGTHVQIASRGVFVTLYATRAHRNSNQQSASLISILQIRICTILATPPLFPLSYMDGDGLILST